MKQVILISLFLVAIAGLASATPVFCSVLMNSDTSGSTGSTCTVVPDPGFYISTLTLTGTDDYTGLELGDPVVSYSGSLSQTTAVFSTPVFCDVNTGLTASDPCAITVIPSSTVSGLDLSTYSVHLIDAGNSVAGGTVVGASIVLTLNYGETMIPLRDTPEPTTIGLAGGALLGLGVLAAMKKRASKPLA